MKPTTGNFFLETIIGLRHDEDLILHRKITSFSEGEDFLVMEFLEREFEKERITYPNPVPVFNNEVALFGAKLLYVVAELILYRELDLKQIQLIWPRYDGKVDAGALLSADLCLRFLPQITWQLKSIDPDDEILSLVNKELERWHYSAVGYEILVDGLQWEQLENNSCLMQLYANRVIERKASDLAALPQMSSWVKETMGNYEAALWPGKIIR